MLFIFHFQILNLNNLTHIFRLRIINTKITECRGDERKNLQALLKHLQNEKEDRDPMVTNAAPETDQPNTELVTRPVTKYVASTPISRPNSVVSGSFRRSTSLASVNLSMIQ